MTDNAPAGDLPRARLAPEPSRWLWLLPLAALLVAAGLGYRAWAVRGTTVYVTLERGYGLRPGDDLRYRGITVGSVSGVELEADRDGVVVRATLRPEARDLARGGSRFWVVRPQLDVTGVAGLETLVGPQYLAVLPGEGPRRYHFVGLASPPLVESIRPGDLEIVLQTRQRGRLRPGAPVLYRQVRVGTVLSVGLTSDGGAVEARAHVEQPYVELIRERTRFWSAGGIDLQVGFRGMSARVETLESLLVGGVALATPPAAGARVHNGHRFDLAQAPEDEWLGWDPLVVIGSSYLPTGAPLPTPLRAVARWSGGLLGGERSRRGWVLALADGLVGPADLLAPAEPPDDYMLEVAGQPLQDLPAPRWSRNGLASIVTGIEARHWPDFLCRRPAQVEDCVLLADPAAEPMPLAAARLTAAGEAWRIDPSLPIDEQWHGACVLARRDGELLGLLIVTTDGPHVALLPQ